MGKPKYSVTWLHNTPTPNQMEYFHAIGQSPDVRLRVLNCSGKFAARPFKMGEPWLQGENYSFEYKVLNGFHGGLGRHREFYINPGILGEVVRSSRDEIWIVGGYTIPTVQMAMWTLALTRRRWLMVSEPPLKAGLWRDLIRRLLLLPFRINARAVLTYGSRRKAAYFQRFLPAEKIFATAQYQNLGPLLSLPRSADGIGNRPMRFFYAGQIESYSGLDVLIEAFNRLAVNRQDVELEVLGDGSERERLQQLVPDALKSRVTFHGVVERERVPSMFARGDVFVHPNPGQGWGMVVNEAMAAGMPVIGSKNVGAAEELIQDGVNGFLLDDSTDVDAFVKKMGFFADHRDQMPEFIRAARNTGQALDMTKGVDEFLAILDRIFFSSSRN
jgi:poly(glycerol-phosphate) alpha-glucosyltransferase